MPGLLHVDDLVLCRKLEEYLRSVKEHFEVYRKRGLKVNARMRKMMALGCGGGIGV